MHNPGSASTPTKRRKAAFTKGEIKTYSCAAQEAGIEEWAVERKDKDGTVTRFICGSVDDPGQSEWDAHEKR